MYYHKRCFIGYENLYVNIGCTDEVVFQAAIEAVIDGRINLNGNNIILFDGMKARNVLKTYIHGK